MATRVRSIILLTLVALLWMEAFKELSSMSLLSASMSGKSTTSNPALPGKSRDGWTGVPGLIKEENNRTIFRYKYGNKTGEASLPSANKLRRLCFYTCLSVHRVGSASVHAGIPPPLSSPQEQAPPRAGPTPWSRHPPEQRLPRSRHPPADGYCCGWYPSYWNAFLLSN